MTHIRQIVQYPPSLGYPCIKAIAATSKKDRNIKPLKNGGKLLFYHIEHICYIINIYIYIHYCSKIEPIQSGSLKLRSVKRLEISGVESCLSCSLSQSRGPFRQNPEGFRSSNFCICLAADALGPMYVSTVFESLRVFKVQDKHQI